MSKTYIVYTFHKTQIFFHKLGYLFHDAAKADSQSLPVYAQECSGGMYFFYEEDGRIFYISSIDETGKVKISSFPFFWEISRNEDKSFSLPMGEFYISDRKHGRISQKPLDRLWEHFFLEETTFEMPSRKYALATVHMTFVLVDEDGRKILHNRNTVGTSIVQMCPSDRGVCLSIEGSKKYISDISLQGDVSVSDTEAFFDVVRNSDHSFSIKVREKFLSAGKNGMFSLAENISSMEHFWIAETRLTKLCSSETTNFFPAVHPYGEGENEEKIRVGFIMQAPSMWGNMKPVYEAMRMRKDMMVYGFVIPGYEGGKAGRTGDYNAQNEYFHCRYGDEVRDICDESGRIIDLDSFRLDYIFYHRPYEEHRSKELRCSEISKRFKTCYIPYGYVGLKRHEVLTVEPKRQDFYRSLSLCFANSLDMQTLWKNTYKGDEEKYLFLGYPPLETIFKAGERHGERKQKNVLWMPRWRESNGGHFLSYKDDFLELRKKYPDIGMMIRPHPLMWSAYLSGELLSVEDILSYWSSMLENKVSLDSHVLIEDTLPDTDILMSDFSSSIFAFFMTGRPVIYFPKLKDYNPDFKLLMKGMYVANSWGDAEKYLDQLLRGDDPLKEIRTEIATTFQKVHLGATNRIIEAVVKDYRSSRR